MTNKHESELDEEWSTTVGLDSRVGLGFLPAAPGANRVNAKLSDNLTSDIEPEDDQDLMDTEDCEPVIRAASKKRPRSLAERIGRPTKSRSAIEVLKDTKGAKLSSSSHVKPKATLGASAKVNDAPKTSGSEFVHVRRVLERALGTVQVHSIYVVSEPLTMRTLWSSHKARAVSTGDAHLAVVADLVHQHTLSEGSKSLIGAQLTFGGGNYAALVDLESNAVLGLLQPPEAYLAGLTPLS